MLCLLRRRWYRTCICAELISGETTRVEHGLSSHHGDLYRVCVRIHLVIKQRILLHVKREHVRVLSYSGQQIRCASYSCTLHGFVSRHNKSADNWTAVIFS